MTVPLARPHTDAIVATLEAAGLTVGNGSGADLTAPYVVVYADAGMVDGPMGDRFADLDQTVILHGIGTGPQQAQWVADKARQALLAATPTVSGRSVLCLDHVDSQPIRRDDDVTPPLYLAVDTYLFSTTPA